MGRAEERILPGQGEVVGLVRTKELGDSKVGDFEAPLGIEKDVFRLDVTVEDSVFMGGLQGGAHFLHESEGFG